VFGLPRASGPFQYPNIAAMYLEGALPVVLAAGVALDAHPRIPIALGHRSRPRSQAAILVEALSLTAVACRDGDGWWWWSPPWGCHALVRRTPGRWRAPVVLGVVGAARRREHRHRSLTGVRMKFWNDTRWYRSAIVPVGEWPTALPPKTRTAVDVDVRNAGVRPWPATGTKHVALAYHWYDESTGRQVVFDGVRTPLPRDIDPASRSG
jgi:hypothetical protein